MDYGKIISISGMTGLYELVGSKKDGAIVRSLDDKISKFVSSRIHNFSHLESIEVYTNLENVNLVEVLKAIQQSGESLPSEKDASAIKSFFEKVYPEIDFERVYASDMKKMVKWYSILQANNVEFKLSEAPEDSENGETTEGQSTETETPGVEETETSDIESEAGAVRAPTTIIPDAEKEEVSSGSETAKVTD